MRSKVRIFRLEKRASVLTAVTKAARLSPAAKTVSRNAALDDTLSAAPRSILTDTYSRNPGLMEKVIRKIKERGRSNLEAAGPYTDLPKPIPAGTYKHDLREFVRGKTGKSGRIPLSTPAGDTPSGLPPNTPVKRTRKAQPFGDTPPPPAHRRGR